MKENQDRQKLMELKRSFSSVYHETSRGHYKKYSSLASELGVTLLNSKIFSKEELLIAYDSDRELNSIPIGRWGSLFTGLCTYSQRAQQLSMSEGCCLYKHLALYEILTVIPKFKD